MILDNIKNSAQYVGLHKNLAMAFEFIARYSQNLPPDGRQEIAGSDVYTLVQSYDSAPAEQKKWESHRRYIDLQFVAEGEETMYYAPLGTLQPKGEYLEEKDCAYYEDGPSTALRCVEGMFAIFFPEDVHKPGCQLSGAARVKKIVVKILI